MEAGVAESSAVYREGAPVGQSAAPGTGPLADGASLGRSRKKRWRLRGESTGAATLVEAVLAARGIDKGDRSARFLTPSLLHLHPPHLLPDIDRAASRLLDALRRGEPVAIYGDYDVDGVTATAVLYHTLHHLAEWLGVRADVRTYVPHRLEEGYGLNGPAIAGLAAAGARVIVSVDCGVTAAEPAQVALASGVDLIITDHHNPPARQEDLPAAYAIVHPRRPGSLYPPSDLCGAGVAYKLAWRLCTMAQGERLNVPTRELLVNLLAFAALGTIADVVPLGGAGGEGDENRVIASFGLTRVRSSPFIGLRALCEAAGLNSPKVDEWDVGFKLAPRLNASGRMQHACEAVELFTTADEDRAAAIAATLEEANSQRRSVEAAIVAQAVEMAEAAGMTGNDRRAIVLAHRDWHAGVVGICCSRLVERYCRPVVLMQIAEHNGETHAHGSGRSIDGYSLHAALQACAGHLVKHGGHDMAAGLRLHERELPAFTEAFIAHAGEHITGEMLTPVLDVDAVIEPGAALRYTLESVKGLERAKPFGRKNPPVRVLLKGVKVAGPPRPFGKGGGASHAEVLLDLVGVGEGGYLTVTAWGMARELCDNGSPLRLTRGQVVDAVVEPRIDTFRGERAAGTLIDLRLV